MRKSLYQNTGSDHGTPFNKVENALADVSADLSNKAVGKSLQVGFESLSEPERENVEHAAANVGEAIETALREADSPIPDDANAMMSAEAVALASIDPKGLDKTLAKGLELGTESYNERDYEETLLPSIFFAANASRQNKFGEAFFETIVLPPSSPYLRVERKSTIIKRDRTHDVTGEVQKSNEQNLAHAIVRPEILAGNSTRIYPIVEENGKNAKYFVSEGQRTINVDGIEIKTGFIKLGEEWNLLGLANAGLATNSMFDTKDDIAQGAHLERVLVKVTDTATNKTSYIPVDVTKAPYNGFLKSTEGKSNDTTLNFNFKQARFNKDTADVNGASAEALASLTASQALVARVEVNGSLNLAKAEGRATAGISRFTELVTANSVEVAPSNFEIEVIGIDIYAMRTNANMRTTGMLVDTSSTDEVFAVNPKEPIYFPKPLAETEQHQDLTDALTEATNLRTNLDAVSVLLSHVDAVADFYSKAQNDITDVKPSEVFKGACDEVFAYHSHIELDMVKLTKSRNTQERFADVRQLLVDTITQHAIRAGIESNYFATFEAMYPGQEPVLVIGTDNDIASKLIVQGEPRTFGDKFNENFEIVASDHPEMQGKVVVSFKVKSKAGVLNPLSIGGRGFVPTVLSTVPVSREGSSSKETQAVVYEIQRCILPVVVQIDVQNLTEALSGHTA